MAYKSELEEFRIVESVLYFTQPFWIQERNTKVEYFTMVVQDVDVLIVFFRRFGKASSVAFSKSQISYPV